MNFIDDLGSTITLSTYPPKRIISVVPSLTELLYDLGLEEEIVGITKFCVFPEIIYRNKPRIGGTKKLNIEKITQLKPDLIIANKEENQKEDIELLSAGFPTYVTDIKNKPDAVEKIQIIGDLTGRGNVAQKITREIEIAFESLLLLKAKPKVAYMIWRDPIMVAGGDTYINDMLNQAGFENAFSELSRYPIVSNNELQNTEVDFIFLSSEPFPFRKKDIKDFNALKPDAIAILVDGTMFSWYGSRLRFASPYFVNLRQELNI